MIKTSEAVVIPRVAATILRTVADRIDRGEIEDIQLISHQSIEDSVSTGQLFIQLNATDKPARSRYMRHVDGAQRLTKGGPAEIAQQ